jgi:hypothetical protein
MVPEILSQLSDLETHFRPPSLTWDRDGTSLNSTFFLEFQEYSNDNVNDIVIFPIEVDFKYELYFMPPNSSRDFDAVSSEWKGFSLKALPCQTIPNPDFSEADKDDDEDFDEDFVPETEGVYS